MLLKRVLLSLCLLSFIGVLNATLVAGNGMTAVDVHEGGYISIASISDEVKGDMTFEAWVLIPEETADSPYLRSIFSRGSEVLKRDIDQFPSDAFTDFHLGLFADGSIDFFMGGFREGDPARVYGLRIVVAGVNVNKGEYNHIAVTFSTAETETNPTRASLYLNGALAQTENWEGGDRQLRASPMIVGHYVNEAGDHWLDTRLDEIRIWNVERTSEEIAANYRTVLKGNEPGLLAYYDFNQAAVDSEYYSVYDHVVAVAENVDEVISGVQGLPLKTTYVVQGTPHQIGLVIFSTGNCTEDVCEVSFPQKPQNGKLVDENGIEIVDPIPFDSPVFYVSSVFVPLTGLADEFTYEVTDGEFTTSPASPVPIFIVATGQCGPAGSNLVYDECGLCGGNGDTCNCNPGDKPIYRQFDEEDLDKVTILFEIDVTLKRLNDFDGEIDAMFDYLAATGTLDGDVVCKLEDILKRIDAWKGLCLDAYCDSVEELSDIIAGTTVP